MACRDVSEVKNKEIKNVSKVVFREDNKVEVHFPNGKFIVLGATTDWGDNTRICITKEVDADE